MLYALELSFSSPELLLFDEQYHLPLWFAWFCEYWITVFDVVVFAVVVMAIAMVETMVVGGGGTVVMVGCAVATTLEV